MRLLQKIMDLWSYNRSHQFYLIYCIVLYHSPAPEARLIMICIVVFPLHQPPHSTWDLFHCHSWQQQAIRQFLSNRLNSLLHTSKHGDGFYLAIERHKYYWTRRHTQPLEIKQCGVFCLVTSVHTVQSAIPGMRLRNGFRFGDSQIGSECKK